LPLLHLPQLLVHQHLPDFVLKALKILFLLPDDVVDLAIELFLLFLQVQGGKVAFSGPVPFGIIDLIDIVFEEELKILFVLGLEFLLELLLDGVLEEVVDGLHVVEDGVLLLLLDQAQPRGRRRVHLRARALPLQRHLGDCGAGKGARLVVGVQLLEAVLLLLKNLLDQQVRVVNVLRLQQLLLHVLPLVQQLLRLDLQLLDPFAFEVEVTTVLALSDCFDALLRARFVI